MKILAAAKPNLMYENINSIKDLVLEARLINGRVFFYETHSNHKNWKVCISEKTVKLLFKNGQIKKRPFLTKENKNFTIVLYRHKKRYYKLYKQLLTKI